MGSAETKPVGEFHSDTLSHLDPAVTKAWRYNYMDLRHRMTERCKEERDFPRKLSISEVVSADDLPYAQDFARYAAFRARNDELEPVLGGYADHVMLRLQVDAPNVSTVGADTHILFTPFTCKQPTVTEQGQGQSAVFFGNYAPTLRDHYHSMQQIPTMLWRGLALDGGVGERQVDNRTVKPTPEQIEAQRRLLSEGATTPSL